MAAAPAEEDAVAAEGCPGCDEIKHHPYHQSTVFIKSSDFIETAIGRSKDASKSKKEKKMLKREKVDEFLKCMNALLNDGYGTLCIHIETPQHLGFFDEVIDKKLLDLIPDDTFFHDNFERKQYDDHHVTYRVIPRCRPISTIVFKTKARTDYGNENPTHGQMRQFLLDQHQKVKEKRVVENRETEQNQKRLKLTLKLDKEVKVENTEDEERKTVIFQEDVRSEAKDITKHAAKRGQQLISSLVSYCSEISPDYISAFSKVPEGGSVYFGVYEHTIEASQWRKTTIPGVNNNLDNIGPNFKLYKDTKDENLYHIAHESFEVPVDKSVKTGEFRARGAVIQESEKRKLAENLQMSIKKAMRVIPAASFQDGESEAGEPAVPVSIHFLPVEECGREVQYVIEVHTEPYAGVCFTDPDGPLAYVRIGGEDGEDRIERFDVKEWIKTNIRDAKRLQQSEAYN